jgi:hypothetical protein
VSGSLFPEIVEKTRVDVAAMAPIVAMSRALSR